MDSRWTSRLVLIRDVKGQACFLKDSLTHATQVWPFPRDFKEKHVKGSEQRKALFF